MKMREVQKKSKEQNHEQPTGGKKKKRKKEKKHTSTGRIPMLAVGSFEPGVSASPYQTATTEIVTRPRLTFAVRSRVYLHHKCFEINLVLDLYHADLDRIGERRGSGRGFGGLS